MEPDSQKVQTVKESPQAQNKNIKEYLDLIDAGYHRRFISSFRIFLKLQNH